MALTADDAGIIKVWDVRTRICAQTLQFGSRYVISKLMSLYDVGRLAFVGSRLYAVEFEAREELAWRQAVQE